MPDGFFFGEELHGERDHLVSVCVCVGENVGVGGGAQHAMDNRKRIK